MLGSPLEKEDEEVKTERAAGHILVQIFKHPAVFVPLLSGAIASGWVRPTTTKPNELRQMIRSEIAPLRAGIEELAKAQSSRVQVNVLQAMLKAERRNAETQ